MRQTSFLPMSRLVSLTAVSAGLIFAGPAFAHHAMDGQTPQTLTQGLLSGLAHPVIGVDHFLFLLVAGLLVTALRGPAQFLIPVVFVISTLAGTALHIVAVGVPLAEIAIALSVIVGGALLVWQRHLDATALGLLFAVVGLFHGYAYAESIIGAEPTPLYAYLLGFSLIQYAVIVAVSVEVTKLTDVAKQAVVARAQRLAGGAALVGGAAFLTLNLV